MGYLLAGDAVDQAQLLHRPDIAERLAKQAFGPAGSKPATQDDRTPDLALVRGSISDVMVDTGRPSRNRAARVEALRLALVGYVS